MQHSNNHNKQYSNNRNKPYPNRPPAPTVNLQSLLESQIDIDYKDVELLRRFTSGYAKIVPRRRSGVGMRQQRKLAQAIKRARFMGLLPYVNR